MKTAILSILTAGALTLAPFSATPAKAADPHDIIGGILGIAILGALASDLNDDRNEGRATRSERYTPYTSNNTYQNGTRRNNNAYWNGGQNYNNGVRNGHKKHRKANRRVLPGECLRVVEGRNNDRIVFPARCLAREGISARQLPDRCERRIDTRRGRLDVYNARCLADRGWSLPRIARR